MTDRNHTPDRNGEPTPEATNRRVLTGLAIVLTAAVFVAGMTPPVVTAPMVSSFLFFASVGAAAAAVFRRDPIDPPNLTMWDQSLIFLLLSIAANGFTDPAAVAEFLGEARPGTEGSPAATDR